METTKTKNHELNQENHKTDANSEKLLYKSARQVHICS